MSSGNSLDLSIKLEENDQKSKEQELQEFVQLTNKIAQSDRNNDLLRQIKKNKQLEVNRIRNAQQEIVDQNQSLQFQLDKLGQSIKEVKCVSKNSNDYYEQLTKKYNQLSLKEKQVEDKNTSLSRDNDHLEKRVIVQQQQYDELIKTNKEKSNYLQKLKKKKDIQDQLIGESERKIEELQTVCQNTKYQAVQLEQALAQQLEQNQRLQHSVEEKERQLDIIRKDREEQSKKQEEGRRTKKQLKAKLQKIEDDIGSKMEELQRLHKIHSSLQKKINDAQHSQTMYEQLILKRRQLVEKLRRDSTRLNKQKGNLGQF